MASKIILLGFLLISSGQLCAEIPAALKEYLSKAIISHTLRDKQSAYFSKDQKLLIEQNYTDQLMNKFHKEIKLTPSFSRTELLGFVKKELGKIFDTSAKLPRAISLGKLKEQVENIFLTVADDKKPVNSYFEAAPWAEQNAYVIQVQYKTVTLPLLVTIESWVDEEIADNSLITLKLYGLRRESTNCLDVSFTRTSHKLEIDWIGTRRAICPIPLKQQGNFLLTFAEALARALKLSTISLTDSSTIQCLENDKNIDLWLLKLFQQGKTWYESKGFSIETEKDFYERKKNELLSFKISDLESNLNSIANEIGLLIKGGDPRTGQYWDFLKMKTVVEDGLRAYKRETNGKLLSGFMAWMHNKSCAQYSDIIDFLFPLSGKLPYKAPVLDREEMNFPVLQTFSKHLQY